LKEIPEVVAAVEENSHNSDETISEEDIYEPQ
jgi:hypothetical protein